MNQPSLAADALTFTLDARLKMDAGPSRKRLRRSTRSCYQCRKRKVKCQLTDEDVEVCAECIKSGTRCSLQPPETEVSSGSSPMNVGKQEYESRLERIEALLKRLVEAQERPQPVASAEPEPIVADSLWNEFLLHSTSDGALPILDPGPSVPQPPDAMDAKQSLVALLPSAQDAITIVTNTTAWLWGAENPVGSVFKPNDASQLLEVATISKGSTMDIAKALLLFALYMQQLPARFDVQFLESQGVEKAIELIAERVKLFVLSHEDEACSLDGIECLTLLSLIQINDGELRKSWMTFRRILDICRLKGLHNSFSIAERNSSSSDVALRRRLWLSAVCGDCYCSMLLGLEPSIGVAPFGPDDQAWNDPLADDDANMQRRIGLIVARIAQRNAVGLHQDRQIFQETDEALNRLQDSVPSSWWRTPAFRHDRPLDSAREPNRIVCQVWFYQAKIFVHMPIAFGKATSESLSSLEHCMEASRITLQRILGLQHAKDQLSRCRSVEQSVFFAAMVLLLAKVQLRCHKVQSRHDSDRVLIEQVIDSFDAARDKYGRERVARQSFDILSAALELADAEFEDVSPLESVCLDTSFSLGPNFGLELTNTGMEDVIVSSILPALHAQSPAARLIYHLFSDKQTTSSMQKHQHVSATQTGFTMDNLIDPTVLQ